MMNMKNMMNMMNMFFYYILTSVPFKCVSEKGIKRPCFNSGITLKTWRIIPVSKARLRTYLAPKFGSPKKSPRYPLVMTNIAMENHHL